MLNVRPRQRNVKYLLLPGLDGTGKLFEPLVSFSPTDASCDVVSYPTDRQMSYAEHAEFVMADFMSGEPFVIVAESFSGPVAVLIASRQPSKLVGVVLCNTFVYRPAWRGLSCLPWAWLFRLPLMRLVVGLHLTGFKDVSRLVGPLRGANALVSPRVCASRIRSALKVDVRDELSALNIPVLYLRGKTDRLLFSGSVRRVEAVRPTTVIVRVPGPHLLLQVEPQPSWQEISAFVSRQCQG